MAFGLRLWAAGLTVLLPAALPTLAAETPKRGGTLTFMIPADAPPSFDAHREATFATVHSAAPFYSVLVRINPEPHPRRPISSVIFAARSRSRATTARPMPSSCVTTLNSTTVRS
jgi:hypothetical protein